MLKEIEFEKQRAVAVLELEQEKARESLHKEIKHKVRFQNSYSTVILKLNKIKTEIVNWCWQEEETDLKLKKAELLSKTQIAAAVAEEKLSYLKDVKDVKQEVCFQPSLHGLYLHRFWLCSFRKLISSFC